MVQILLSFCMTIVGFGFAILSASTVDEKFLFVGLI
jgi:hypothetical protein